MRSGNAATPPIYTANTASTPTRFTGPPPSCDLEAYSRQSEKTFGILESMTTGIDQNLLAMFKEIFISTEVPEAVE